jgi:hypothetical protein
MSGPERGCSLPVSINDNPILANIDGLSRIKTISESLTIIENNSLSNLDALAKIKKIGWNLYITDNGALTNIDGLFGITTIQNTLHLYSNDDLCQSIVDEFAAGTVVLGSSTISGNDDSC